MYEFTHSSTHLQSIFPSQCPIVELDPTGRYGACATLTEPVCKPLNMLFTSWEHIASLDFESLWNSDSLIDKSSSFVQFLVKPASPTISPTFTAGLEELDHSMVLRLTSCIKSEQDHRRWRYHHRLLDYQSPYFQLITE